MFTSRAEHRLLFNHGSAEFRYLNKANQFSLLSKSRLKLIQENLNLVDFWFNELATRRNTDGKTYSQHIKSNSYTISQLPDDFLNSPKSVLDQVLYKIVYDGYLQRETKTALLLNSAEKSRYLLNSNLTICLVFGMRHQKFYLSLDHVR